MTEDNIAIKLLKKQYPYLVAEFGIAKIGVFGSVSKGTEREGSDVDIVIEFRRPIGFKFIELVEYLENLINKKVDVLTKDGIENIRIREIAEDIKRNITYVQAR